ncbi:MAG: peptidase [Deltaproteobacteria bacterium HGW-Deltaproteobacteria-2]|jgi:predicted Zn-dependent protease|nr:MAG: peptidase [Deltaproteobacteria bacterium HGW-Deltaproteobacteria-2]
MRVIYFFLIFIFATFMPQAQALDLGEVLKDVVKETTAGKTTGTESKASPTSSTGSEGKKTFNWKSPTPQEEIRIGREITGNLLGASALVKDAALQKYVNQVGRWVANQSERADLPWHFGVIESEDINAFAAPGGYVIITKGLYRKLENEAQLAGVLSHEIAHVVRSHHLKILQKSQLLDLGAGLLGKQIGKDNQVIQKVIGSGAEICARSLDKSAEFEADRMGVSLTTRAGYEPYGLPEVLQAIGQTGKNESSVALLFKTHPHPDDRLLKLDEAIGNRLDNVKGGKTLSNRFYKLKN